MTKYSKEEIISAIEAVKAGESIAQVAKQKHISKSQLGLLVGAILNTVKRVYTVMPIIGHQTRNMKY